MPFVRDRTPTSGPPALVSWLERTLSALDDFTRQIETVVNELVRLKGIEGLEVRMRWDDTIDVVATPASAGFVKGNDAVPANITQFSMSRIDEFGRLVLTGGTVIPTDEGFYEIQDLSRSLIMRYDVGSTQIRDTDLLIDVVVQEITGSNPQTDDQLEVSFWPTVIDPLQQL